MVTTVTSLLKFSTSDAVWYINVYTQAEDRARACQERYFFAAGNGLRVTVAAPSDWKSGWY